MKRLFIVRHGKTSWNLEKRIQGSGHDIPLCADDSLGYPQLAQYLQDYQFSAIYASPLRRAVETGERTLAQFHRTTPTIQTLPDLIELGFGAFEGRTKTELITTHLELFKKMSRRENDPELLALGVEDFTLARHRFARTLRDIAAQLADNENALIFAHGGITQLGIKEVTGNEHLLGLKNLSTSILAIHEEQFFLDTYNQTAYLPHVDLDEGNVTIL